MMLKRICAIALSVVMFASVVVSTVPALNAAAAATKSQADAATSFTFKGSMSLDVLRSYASRAVTHSGFLGGATTENFLFEEDLRFLQRIGAKYIGRAASISWSGNLTASDVEKHLDIVEAAAKKAHAADPEMILQAGIFEIAYKGTVNNIKIPAYVFEAFGQPVENRNFKWEKVVYPKYSVDKNGNDIGIGCWGNNNSGVPDIKQLETKMYFYYWITRYIDAGIEAFHMGQAEKMAQYIASNNKHWKELLDKARAYAKKNARRGVALFDYHDAIDGNISVGNELVFDIQAAGMCPNETEKEERTNENGKKEIVYKAELKHYKEGNWLSWVGRSEGGKHPLGFTVKENVTIIEFDNYGGNGQYGTATKNAFFNWGQDDVTWFALQPEWYRNQFLKETDAYLANSPLCLIDGKQYYFMQPVTNRVITPGSGNAENPKLTYVPDEYFNDEFFFDYMQAEKVAVTTNNDGTFGLEVRSNYRANKQTDACPIGFNQEDTIREIFLGKNAKEDPKLSAIVLPEKYADGDISYTPPVATTSSNKVTVNTSSKKNNQTTSTPKAPTASAVTDSTTSQAVTSEEITSTTETESTTESTVDSSEITTDGNQPNNGWVIWVIVGVVAVLLIGGGVLLYFLVLRKK